MSESDWKQVTAAQQAAIAADAIARRDAVEQMYIDGQLPLWDALIECAATWAPISQRMVGWLISAEASYQRGEFSDLAEPLGVRLSASQKRKVKTDQLHRHIVGMVDYVNAGEEFIMQLPGEASVRRVKLKKKPKTAVATTRSDTVTAFDEVARRVGLSSERVRKIYQQGSRKRK